MFVFAMLEISHTSDAVERGCRHFNSSRWIWPIMTRRPKSLCYWRGALMEWSWGKRLSFTPTTWGMSRQRSHFLQRRTSFQLRVKMRHVLARNVLAHNILALKSVEPWRMGSGKRVFFPQIYGTPCCAWQQEKCFASQCQLALPGQTHRMPGAIDCQ